MRDYVVVIGIMLLLDNNDDCVIIIEIIIIVLLYNYNYNHPTNLLRKYVYTETFKRHLEFNYDSHHDH
jgi:hypothetical protein